MRAVVSLAMLAFVLALPASARPRVPALTPETVNTAPLGKGRPGPAAILKAQVLLDRAKFSPGTIDAHDGDNFGKALRAFQQANELKSSGKLDAATFERLTATSNDEVLVRYSMTEADVKGPFVDRVPHDFRDMAKLERLGYRSPRELLAERFHASEELLQTLNRSSDFKTAGAEIVVPAVTTLDDAAAQAKAEIKAQAKGQSEKKERSNAQAKSKTSRRQATNAAAPTDPPADMPTDVAARVEVNKRERSVRVYAADDTLIAFYPASIGSTEKPAPSGSFEIRKVTPDPTYRYDPAYAFKGQKAKKPVEISPGPNNPVGLVWIALSLPSYGLHGTPEPGSVGKTASHGCIRLTNWDALALARQVKKGTPVAFID